MRTKKVLTEAKKNKKDEFFTRLDDIEHEVVHYKQHLENKIIYCNCDDPTKSNFYKYFAENFQNLKLKKVIASCKQENGKGYFYIYENKKGQPVIPSELDLIRFEGDGDFRSQECLNFLQESDMVITNPPFSLFREYINQLAKLQKKFLIIGNINCLTYKEVFGLIQEKLIWLGVNFGRGISGFIVPDNYELYGTERTIDEFGNKIVATNNCL